jgi:uncharacterized protein YggU (UPF0235/DUF167 family)
MVARPWTASADSVVVTVRLTPRGGRAAIVKLIANTLGVAVRDVSLVAGTSARIKRLKIAGTGAMLAATLEKIFTME